MQAAWPSGAAPALKVAQRPPHQLCLPAPAAEASGVDPFSSAILERFAAPLPQKPLLEKVVGFFFLFL